MATQRANQTQAALPTTQAGEWAMGTYDAPAEVLAAITRMGIPGMGKLSEGRLSSIGAAAARMESAGWWAMGDAACELANRHEDSDRPRVYSTLADRWGVAIQTIENRASVCRRVPYADRRADLSPSHHAEVAGIGLDSTARQAALAHAATEHLSVSAFRAYLQELVPAPERPNGGRTRAARLPGSAQGTQQNAPQSHQDDRRTADGANGHSDTPAASDPIRAQPEHAIGIVPGSSADRQVRPLVIGESVSARLIALCGTASAAEAKAADIIAEWLTSHATTNRMAAVAADAGQAAFVHVA